MDEKIDKAIETAKGILPSRKQLIDAQQVTQAILNLAHVKALYNSINPTTEMDEELNDVLERVRSNLDPALLMYVTQASLNLMHAKKILTDTSLKVAQVKELLTEGKPTIKKSGAGAS